jgi:hypothetical protein
MSDISGLAGQIDAAFTAVEQEARKFQADQMQEHQERQKRMDKLGKVFDELREIWRPRLELLVKKFGDRVKVTPRIVPSTREAAFEFQSNLAKVSLKFSAYTDRDVKKVILGYDLDIIPILMRYTPHADIEFPLDKVDKDAAAKWVEARIVEFVRTYLSLGDNEWYLKDQMVEDPIAHVRFPKQAAGATLEWKGQKLYFLGEETRREYAERNSIAIA